jgi:outer membrane protein assembly factor BamA
MWKIVYILLLVAFALAKGGEVCTVDSIAWVGEHDAFDESQMAPARGNPCDAWKPLAAKLERYYEDKGFVAVRVLGNLRGEGPSRLLELRMERGPGYVWAAPENLDNGGTKAEVFRKLSGLEEGDPVSLSDLERSERKLARLGYYEMTAPTKLFRDASRNRIIPAFSMRRANVSRAEGLLTYSSEDNVWEGLVDVELYNIAGTARDLMLEGFSGENSRHLTGSYKEPWIFGTSWNAVVRGSFDEDSEISEKTAVGELGVTRDIGFDFTLGVFLGISNDGKLSSFEMSYVSLDRFILPRSGWRMDGSLVWKMDRPDSLDNFLKANARMVAYMPLYGNFISRFTGAAGGVFPTDATLGRMDLFALGGLESFKGMQYRMLRSRSFGFSEFALLWQDGYDLSVEVFYQPGLYRRMNPGHGWAREQNYGLGFTQYRGNWSINLYYALRNGCNYLDGILGFGVKTLF